MNFTSKRCNTCELTGITYDLNDKGIKTHQIRCADKINSHHCSGVIMYHIDNKKYIDVAEMYFEWQEKIIHNLPWSGIKINIERSDKSIQEAIISEENCLRLSNNNTLIVYVDIINDEEIKNKWVPLTNYFSKSLNRTVKGIIELNPNIKNYPLNFKLKKHPEWMNKEEKNGNMNL